MNLGYTIRGMDLAIESGMCATEAVNVWGATRRKYGSALLNCNEKTNQGTWLRRDMKLYKICRNSWPLIRVFLMSILHL